MRKLIIGLLMVVVMATPACAFEWVDYFQDSLAGITAYEFLEWEDLAIGGKYDAKYFWNLVSPSVGYITTDEKSTWGLGVSLKVNTLAEKLKLENPLKVFDTPVGLNVGYGSGKKWYLWIHAEIL